MQEDWGASGRTDLYNLELVDPFSLERTGSADFIKNQCSITWDMDSKSMGQASIVLANSEWRQGGLDRMARVIHTVKISGREYTEVMGTFFVDSFPQSSKFHLTKTSLICYSALWRLTEDSTCEDIYAGPGSTILPIASNAVTDVGGKVSIGRGATDSDTGIYDDVLIPAGTNRFDAVQSLASKVGCTVGVDDYGNVTFERYLDPATEVAPIYEFSAVNSIYLPGMEPSDEGTVYNRVMAYWSREQAPDPDDGLGLSMRVVVDLDPGERYSYERIGRRMTYVLKVANPCTYQELRDTAARFLKENSAPSRYIQIEHAGVPNLRVGQVVTYENTTDQAFEESYGGVKWLCQIRQMDISSLGNGCMTKTKLKVLGGA